MPHANNSAIIARLKRVEGHVRSVMAMVESGRACLDIAQQLHAIEAAVASAKSEMIQHHIEHCLDEQGDAGPAEKRALIDEMKSLAKYL